MDAEQRRLKSQKAAAALHKKYDGRTLTTPARTASATSLRNKLDPEGEMTPEEYNLAKSSYFRNLNSKSVEVRRRKAAPQPATHWEARPKTVWFLYRNGRIVRDQDGSPISYPAKRSALNARDT